MTPVEAMAADALLDRRLKINLPAPWLLRIFGRRSISIRVKSDDIRIRLPAVGSFTLWVPSCARRSGAATGQGG